MGPLVITQPQLLTNLLFFSFFSWFGLQFFPFSFSFFFLLSLGLVFSSGIFFFSSFTGFGLQLFIYFFSLSLSGFDLQFWVSSSFFFFLTIHIVNFLRPLSLGFSFHWAFHKWPSTFSPLNIWNVSAIHMWMKRRFCPFLIFFLLLQFRGFFFLSCGPLFIHTYILLPAANRVVSSNFPVWQLFSKQSRHFINSIPFWWLTLHLFSCWH